MLLTGEIRGVGYISHLRDDFYVDFLLGSFGEHPDLVESGLTLERNAFYFDCSIYLTHICIHLLVSFPRSAHNVCPFFAL